MASRILAMTKENTGLASPRSVFEVKVAAFARFEFALNLQSLKNLLARVWTFSVAMDMATLGLPTVLYFKGQSFN